MAPRSSTSDENRADPTCFFADPEHSILQPERPPMIVSRRKALFLAFLCVALATDPSASGADERPDASAPIRVRVLSYNIHHGEGTDRKFDLDRIARVIDSAKPDLVALQEVDQGTRRSSGVDQPAELARRTGLRVVFGENIRFGGGGYGNAVLSRHPIRRYENHPLPSFYEGEQRGVLEVEVEIPGASVPILFFATHLDYRPKDNERLASVKKIDELVARDPARPTLLAGDLNALPDSETLRRFRSTWKSANDSPTPTYPSSEPTRQIDYILARPAPRWKILSLRVLDAPLASDHRPILAVFELQGQPNE